MSDLQFLARKKVEAEIRKRITALPIQIEAIKHEHAAKGMLLSGATLKRSLSVCKLAITAQTVTVITEYRWAISTALFASQSWIDRLVNDATQSLSLLHEEAIIQLKKVVELVGRPELLARLVLDLEATRNTGENDIALALRSSFAERSRGLAKSILGWIPRVIARIFSAGA